MWWGQPTSSARHEFFEQGETNTPSPNSGMVVTTMLMSRVVGESGGVHRVRQPRVIAEWASVLKPGGPMLRT